LNGDRKLELYDRFRLRHQLAYYTNRTRTFERAMMQLGWLSAIVLVAGSTAATLAGKEVAHARWWSVLAAVLPAIATALAAYGALFGFEQQAKLYGDASKALQRLAREADGLAAGGDDAARRHVERVEDVFRQEQAQWGQFASEQKRPPTAS
jgi:hypothetical protein